MLLFVHNIPFTYFSTHSLLFLYGCSTDDPNQDSYLFLDMEPSLVTEQRLLREASSSSKKLTRDLSFLSGFSLDDELASWCFFLLALSPAELTRLQKRYQLRVTRSNKPGTAPVGAPAKVQKIESFPNMQKDTIV